MKLTKAMLDRRIEEKANTMPFIDLLLSKGAIEGPFKNPKPFTVGYWTHVKRRLQQWQIDRETQCLIKN